MPPNYTLPPSLALAFSFISASYGQHAPVPQYYHPPPPYSHYPPPPPYYAPQAKDFTDPSNPTNPEFQAPVNDNANYPTNPQDIGQETTQDLGPTQSQQQPQPQLQSQPQIQLQPQLQLQQQQSHPTTQQQPHIIPKPLSSNTATLQPQDALLQDTPNQDKKSELFDFPFAAESSPPPAVPASSPPATFATFLLRLCKQNDLEGFDKVFATLQNKGTQLDADTYRSLFAHMCNIGDDVRMRKLQLAMTSASIPLDSSAALALFAYCVRSGNVDAATLMITNPQKGVTFSKKDGFVLLDTVTRHMKPAESVRIFEVMNEAGLPVAPAARNLVLDHCIASSDWKACERMLMFMLELPSVTNNAFIIALRELARARQHTVVIRLLDSMRARNRAGHAPVYAAIMDAVREPQYAEVLKALKKDMADKRIKPNKEVCEIVISCATQAMEFHEVISIYKFMRRENLKRTPPVHKQIVEAYAHRGDPDPDFYAAIEENHAGLINIFHLFRVLRHKHVCALVFRAMCRHHVFFPSVVNFAVPLVCEYAQKEIMGQQRGSEYTEALLGKGWPQFLVEVLSMCKKEQIELWPRVHASVQQYVKWRTKEESDNKATQPSEQGETSTNNYINNDEKTDTINNTNEEHDKPILNNVTTEQWENVQGEANWKEEGRGDLHSVESERASKTRDGERNRVRKGELQKDNNTIQSRVDSKIKMQISK